MERGGTEGSGSGQAGHNSGNSEMDLVSERLVEHKGTYQSLELGLDIYRSD